MAKRRLKEIEKINISGLGFVPLKQDSAEFTPEYQKRDVQKGSCQSMTASRCSEIAQS